MNGERGRRRGPPLSLFSYNGFNGPNGGTSGAASANSQFWKAAAVAAAASRTARIECTVSIVILGGVVALSHCWHYCCTSAALCHPLPRRTRRRDTAASTEAALVALLSGAGHNHSYGNCRSAVPAPPHAHPRPRVHSRAALPGAWRRGGAAVAVPAGMDHGVDGSVDAPSAANARRAPLIPGPVR